jgi:fatty acid desaturase
MARFFRDRQEFQSYHVGEYWSYIIVAAIYFFILALVLLIHFSSQTKAEFSFGLLTLFFILIGWAQYSLGNAMHEALHFNFANKKSDILASLVTAYPIGFTLKYRDFHFKHHKHVGTVDDPEYELYTDFPKSKIGFIMRLVWFASGLPAFYQFIKLQFLEKDNESKIPLQPRRLSKTLDFSLLLISQSVIFFLFFMLFDSIWHYFIFWILPIATVGKLLSSTRLLCEHGSPNHDWVVRSINGPRWSNYLLGAFDFNFHGEHHLYPTVPHAQLKRLHEKHAGFLKSEKAERPFDQRFEIYCGSYLGLLTSWFLELPWYMTDQNNKKFND